MTTKNRHYLALMMVGSLLILSACANPQRFVRMMDSHVGKPISEAQQQFGYAFIKRELDNQQTAYTWNWIERSISPGFRSPDVIRSWRSAGGDIQTVIQPGHYFPPEYYEFTCEFSFIADDHGRVLTWHAHGNACASYTGPDEILKPAKPPGK